MRIGRNRQPIIFFVGEKDHLVPIHDLTLYCTVLLRAIGHLFIHNGPLFYGLSPADKCYWALTGENNDSNLVTLPASVCISDIPDVDLREYIQEVNTHIH